MSEMRGGHSPLEPFGLFWCSQMGGKWMRYCKQFGGILFGTLALCAASAADAQPFWISCPTKIEVVESANSVPSDWAAMLKKVPAYLTSTLIGAHDEHLGSYAPDNEQHLPGGRTKYIWELPPDEQSFVLCHYRNTNVVLSKPIPKGTRSCSVITEDVHGVSRGDVSCD